jgi:hypothetical protein
MHNRQIFDCFPVLRLVQYDTSPVLHLCEEGRAPIHYESYNLELKIWDLVEDYNISNVLSQLYHIYSIPIIHNHKVIYVLPLYQIIQVDMI